MGLGRQNAAGDFDLIAETSDLGGPGICGSIEVPLEPGVYLLITESAVPIPDYFLEASFVGTCGNTILEAGEECDDGNLDPADGCSAVCRVEYPDVSAGGDFARPGFLEGESDTLQFTLADEVNVRLETSDGDIGCPANTDTTLTLLLVQPNGALVQLALDDDGGSGLCSAIEQQLPPGDYRVRVDGLDGSAVAPYTLTATFGAPAPPE
ncbi:MAG: hypothetical protein H6704_10090 [Myxococcales bacterium]|nr:hypothetical protein [Myxococcales bacterium]